MPDETTRLYKILPSNEWQRAIEEGMFLGCGIDLTDGFIHLSSADQVFDTARVHFRGQSGLVLVEFNACDLSNDLRWERSRAGDLFPHVYGKIPTAAAARIWPLTLGKDGVHQLPAEFAH